MHYYTISKNIIWKNNSDKYVNQYMDISCVNPLDTRAIDYNMFPYYDADRLEHDGYSSEDIHYVTESDKKDNNICVSMQSVQRALMHMCKKTGIKYYSPHQIRFYGAMAMMNETCDIYATANLLGHSTLAMTKKYSDKLNSSRVYAGPLLS